MKITHNEEPKEFTPFSITITFESAQEAINLLHFYNCSHRKSIEENFNSCASDTIPNYDKSIEYEHGPFKELKSILQSKGIIK